MQTGYERLGRTDAAGCTVELRLLFRCAPAGRCGTQVLQLRRSAPAGRRPEGALLQGVDRGSRPGAAAARATATRRAASGVTTRRMTTRRRCRRARTRLARSTSRGAALRRGGRTSATGPRRPAVPPTPCRLRALLRRALAPRGPGVRRRRRRSRRWCFHHLLRSLPVASSEVAVVLLPLFPLDWSLPLGSSVELQLGTSGLVVSFIYWVFGTSTVRGYCPFDTPSVGDR